MKGHGGRRAASFTSAVLLIIFCFLLGGLVTFGSIGTTQEQAVLREFALRQGQSPDWVITFFQGVSWAGDAAQRSIALIGFALILFWQRRWRTGLIMLIFPAIAGATSSLFKELFARARPDIVPHLDHFGNLSFPSGHATNAAAILILAALLIPARHRGAWLALAVIGAGLVASSRVMLGVHWPSDVVAGFALGLGFAMAGLTAARRWGEMPRR